MCEEFSGGDGCALRNDNRALTIRRCVRLSCVSVNDVAARRVRA